MLPISILMTAYNAEKYIKEAIYSIINQTFTDWELIIIDDCSTDSTNDIIHKIQDSRIICYKNDVNRGIIASANRGIKLCKGKYIARIDADDIALPSRLKTQFNYMETHPNTIMCGSNAIIIDENGKEKGKILNFKNDSLLKISLLFTVPFINSTAFIRSTILKDNQYDPEFEYAEDYEFWTRISKLGEMTNLETPLVQYRWHGENVSIVHQEIQKEVKNKILIRQLSELGIQATKREIETHRNIFGGYQFGKKTLSSGPNLSDTKFWFKKITKKNQQIKLYNQTDLIAFLWSRWIILSLLKKDYLKALFPGLKINLGVIYKTFIIILLLRKKSWKQKKN